MDQFAMPAFTGSLDCWLAFIGVLAVSFTLIFVGFRLQWISVQLAGCLVVGGCLMWAASPAHAQDPLGAAARELVDAAEARGRDAEEALRDWAARASQISEAHAEEATALAAMNEAKVAEGMKIIGEPEEDGGALYVAVSLTMPAEALRQLSQDAEKAGARLVIRGLVDGSFERTVVVAKEVFGQDALSGLAIEPQVFRAYGVDRVPTFIAAQAPVQPCQDRIAGNISLAEALRQLSQRGDAAPGVARAALERLEG
jgi:conjugal transfer pilus assembly protein TrbC